MLKHGAAWRQGKSICFGVTSASSTSPDNYTYVHPGVSVLAESQPAGNPQPQVHAGGVQNFPAELVLAVVVVVEVGRFSIGGTTRQIVSPVSVFVGLPVFVLDVPWPDPLTYAPVRRSPRRMRTLKPLAYFKTLCGNLVPGIADVLRGKDLAPGRPDEVW